MFRPIRRKTKEISLDEARQVLQHARYGVLAVNGEDGYPYAIPINYIYQEEENKIIFHGARAGHKADALKACDKVCFTACGDEVVKDDAWAPYVKSTVVFGRCHAIEDRDEAMAVLRKLAMKYYPTEALVEEEIASSGKAVQLYVIEIEHISGKEIQEK